jgi:hypothetical protein
MQITVHSIFLEIYDGRCYILRKNHYYIPWRIRWLIYCAKLKENGCVLTKCYFVFVTVTCEILSVHFSSKCLQLYCYTSIGGETVLRHMSPHSPLYIIHVIITRIIKIPKFPTIVSGSCISKRMRRKNSTREGNANVTNFSSGKSQ